MKGLRRDLVGASALALWVVMLLLPAGAAFAVNADECAGSGGTAECTGPVLTHYKYYYNSSSWNGPYGFGTEQAAVSHFQNAVATAYHACTSSLTNPSFQPAPSGTNVGDIDIPNPPTSGGPNFRLSFDLGTEKQQTKWEIKVTGTQATDSTPACAYALNSGNVQLVRTRTVQCPAGYQPNYCPAYRVMRAEIMR